ncbi:GNAT family N-acetyltransferase [Photobacterium sp. GJ3]|nr:GNAT family N-acetyltransferase [Photobacterium sp. GJ3]
MTLRAIKASDAEALLAIYSDVKTMRYIDEPVFDSMAMVAQMLASVRKLAATGESLEWAIECHQSGNMMGTCGLHSFSADNRTCEVGCLLASAYWGKGYMSDALQQLMQYARDQKLKTLWAKVDPQNGRSIRLFLKFGFQPAASDTFYLFLDR